MKIHHLKQHQLSKSNTSDQNFIKLGHIIMYHNVFKFQNGPYHIMPSGVIALLLMTIPYLYKFGNSGGIRVPWTHFYFFFKINVFEKLFQESHQSVKQFGPRSDQHFVLHYLDPNCFQTFSADHTSQQTTTVGKELININNVSIQYNTVA